MSTPRNTQIPDRSPGQVSTSLHVRMPGFGVILTNCFEVRSCDARKVHLSRSRPDGRSTATTTHEWTGPHKMAHGKLSHYLRLVTAAATSRASHNNNRWQKKTHEIPA